MGTTTSTPACDEGSSRATTHPDPVSWNSAWPKRSDAGGVLAAVVGQADAEGAAIEVTLATACGCPYEHRVAPDRVVAIAEACVAHGVSSIGLADTIGVAVPTEVRVLVRRIRRTVDVPIGGHVHDRRVAGLANALAAMDTGVRRIDGSVGGLGGCPFASGASGNLPLENLAHVLEESGVSTGVSVLKASWR